MSDLVRNQILFPVGVCVLNAPPHNASRSVQYANYIFEIMDSAGVCYSREELSHLSERLDVLGVLVTVGDATFSEELSQRLRDWIEQGGAWISIAGTCGQENLLGVVQERPAFSSFGGGMATLGEGYLKPEAAEHPLISHLEIPLHYFNGAAVCIKDARVLASALNAHGHETIRAALTEKFIGRGIAMCIAPDVTGTIVRIQQGRGAVTRDGVPADDGTAPVCDEVLKSGDGGSLDWIFDRQPVPGCDGLCAFLQPIADQWREIILRAIFYGASVRGISVPVLWYYPRDLTAIAHISLDTDNNVPEHAELLFNLLEEKNTKATWCTIMPGLPRAFMEKIHAAGHELAMHYDAMTDGLHWGSDEFASQWRYLVDLFDGKAPVTNKNHYLRWEGDIDIWEWCAAHQIQLDQSKGASKTGEAGFNFGTCRPYFPVSFRGSYIDVLELPTFTQDLEVFIPKSFLDSLIKPVVKHYGVLHLLFHPAHTHKPATNQALREAIDVGRAAGLEWWTAAQINSWERARRTIRWENYQCEIQFASDGAKTHSAEVQVSAGQPLPEATILWSGPPADGCENLDSGECRWGFQMKHHTVDLSETPVAAATGFAQATRTV